MFSMSDNKPKFGQFNTWGACSRCGARVLYKTLQRERLTGLLVCSRASGRPVTPCWDPWPAVYDFQVFPDQSIEPPPEPLPGRYMLDNIFSASTYNSVAANTPGAYANAPKAAPSDNERLRALLQPPTGTYTRGTANFSSYENALNQNQNRATLVVINPADYDGTYVPSNSVRTAFPPEPEAAIEGETMPPLSVIKGI